MAETKAKIIKEEKNAEYFFEYQMQQVVGSDEIDIPKIYFERDYTKGALPYKMYITPKAWLLDDKPKDWHIKKEYHYRANNKEKDLLYNKIEIIYDVKGIDCAPLTDKQHPEYTKPEFEKCYDLKALDYNLDTFYSDGCKILIAPSDSHVMSGVGVISMYKDTVLVAKYYFSVNFSFRKKIAYKLKASKNNVRIVFTSPDRPDGVNVKLLYNTDGLLPCLKTDSMQEYLSPSNFELNFKKSPRFSINCKITKPLGNTTAFSVRLADENISKYYILECIENNSLNINKPRPPIPDDKTCPYCHKKITVSNRDRRYKKGGNSCDGQISQLIITKNKGGNLATKCLYCSSDLSDSENFNVSRLRVLPENFLNHLNYKIAFTGSTRAGKTTYISRFFDIISNGINNGSIRCQMAMNQLQNSLNLFNIGIKSASIPEIQADDKNATYFLTTRNWTDTQREYSDRVISIDPPLYPSATANDDTGSANYDLASYPFIAEVNNEAYVSFYDIAGEDAKSSKKISALSNGKPIGVFCLINGNQDNNGTSSVITMLNESDLPANSPIAVILTKFDTIDKQFDSNCFCLRTDYLDEASKRYSNTPIEWEIDYSSKEIESYLINKGLIKNNIFSKYKNVKFFCVSAFNFNDSIKKEEDNDLNAPGRVRFNCSSKRIELPFLWMLKQFNLIK